MSYPKLVVGNGSRAVFKMFSPTLGFALTSGCEMEKFEIITSEYGTKDVPYELYAKYDNDPEITAELVQARHNLGLRLASEDSDQAIIG